MAPTKRKFQIELTPDQRRQVSEAIRQSEVIPEAAALYALGECTREELIDEIDRVEQIAESIVLGRPVHYGH